MAAGVWQNKVQCDEAEKVYYERLYGRQAATGQQPGPAIPAATGSLTQQIAQARQHIQNSLQAVEQAGQDKAFRAKFAKLEGENTELKKVTEELKKLVVTLTKRVEQLEKGGVIAASVENCKDPQDSEDDVDLFGSDDDEEDEEKARITAERLKAYHEKKSKKPAVIAKTSVLFDVKPWDDETNMTALKDSCLSIAMDGLVWGASKLVPVGYGINKLQIMCTVEDEKVSIEELGEKMEAFDDFVQSVDVAAMNKI